MLTVAACGSSSKKTTSAPPAGGASTTAASKYAPIPAGPIKLAVITAVSGVNAAYGTTTKKAFETVTQKQFNLLHPDGIDGHPVQIVVYDDGSDVTKGVQAANQIVNDKVAAVITVSTSPATYDQEMAVLNKAKLPVVAYPGGDKYSDASQWPYTFGVTGTTKAYEQAAADWIGKHTEIKQIAVMTDGTPQQTEVLNDLLNGLKTSAPSVQVVKTVTISPGAVDVSTALAQLKQANADLAVLTVGYGFGPIWAGMQAASWTPKMLVSPGVWYDGFSSMGNQATNAVAAYEDCVQPNHAPFPKTLVDLMDGYASIFGSNFVNYLTFVQSDSAAPELVKLAIEKNHSVDPDAIKTALEGMGPTTIFGTYQFSYTPTDHWAVTGQYGPAMCKVAAPFSDGNARLPFIAP
jgi:branched-chain amino acid transport system substrate-binding protein